MPDQRLDDTAVIVTGGAHGLGRAMVLELAEKGASVLVADVSEENLAALGEEAPPNVICERADLTVSEDVERVVERCRSLFGRVDMVVNNAGISPWSIRPDRETNPIRFWQLSREDVTRFLAIHTIGPFLLSKAVLPHLVDQGWGRIVTVTTSHRTMIGPGCAPYGPAKAASEALAAVMAGELEGTGVSVNVLIPGGAAATHPERDRTSSAQLIDPSVMGPPAVWLASHDSDGVSARRIIAAQWDVAATREENLARASAPIAWAADPTAPANR